MFYPAPYLSRVWLGSKVSHTLLPGTVRPLAAHVKFTENCQAKCVSCDYWKTRWQDGISTPKAVELLNDIAALNIRSLRLTGGEPLLRRDLFQVLDQANASRFEQVILQTNGLLIKKLHRDINASPITRLSVSIDGMKGTNDVIRGIRGYFDLAFEGIKLLKNKTVAIAVTLNRMSSSELQELAETARSVGATVEFNILSRNLFFFQNADIDPMWPNKEDTERITRFLRDDARRPEYEIDYVRRYYDNEELNEPPCVLGFLQVFVLSNGDVLTGCYPLKPVGNILSERLATILASDAYRQQAISMLRRDCPGCTCGVESSLAMQNAGSSALYHIKKLASTDRHRGRAVTQPEIAHCS